MEFVIDFSVIPTNSPIDFGVWFFRTIGWIVPVYLFIYGLILGWLANVRNNYRRRRKYILLAIDIPKNNEQTPKAVENIFSHLAGAHQDPGKYDKWWNGEIPNSFSFEIVSIGGYIQFIIHLVDTYRDMVESIIYAQYPDAEITEIEDYTKRWNVKFPNEKYQLHGVELKLKRNDVYPLITYTAFEDAVSGELKDPMASILEGLSRINAGEEFWLQYVITPANNDWGEKADPIIKKLIGAKVTKKNTPLDWLFEIPNFLLDAINPAPAGEHAAPKKDEPPTMVMHMTAGQKNEVEAIEHKTTKIGFHVKIRMVYLAEKKVFQKQKLLQGVYGAFKQFNDLGLNALRPDMNTFTGHVVWFKKRRVEIRRNKILYKYKWRGHWLEPGYYGYVLGTEELATLWHFPIMTVKTPLVKHTDAKKAEPPMTLPTAGGFINPVTTATAKPEPPENLPTTQ